METFAVGHDLAKGEKCVWVVEGGKFKASFLASEEPLLISETVVSDILSFHASSELKSRVKIVGLKSWKWTRFADTYIQIPGFEYSDHDFMTQDVFERLVPEGKREELQWLVRKGDKPEESELK